VIVSKVPTEFSDTASCPSSSAPLFVMKMWIRQKGVHSLINSTHCGPLLELHVGGSLKMPSAISTRAKYGAQSSIAVKGNKHGRKIFTFGTWVGSDSHTPKFQKVANVAVLAFEICIPGHTPIIAVDLSGRLSLASPVDAPDGGLPSLLIDAPETAANEMRGQNPSMSCAKMSTPDVQPEGRIHSQKPVVTASRRPRRAGCS
jgi:hypothetical protein